MASAALAEWFGARAGRLGRLVDAHRAVAGPGPGRRWLTSEVNHALIVRLASEFQGFCRNLHDEATDALIGAKFDGDPDMASVFRGLVESQRKLDRGNANWGNVCDDFSRLGISVADDLESLQASRYKGRVAKLAQLNQARNAIAHDDRARLAVCEAESPFDLGHLR